MSLCCAGLRSDMGGLSGSLTNYMSALLTFQQQTGSDSQFWRKIMSTSDAFDATNGKMEGEHYV
jgi:hypothetical protein